MFYFYKRGKWKPVSTIPQQPGIKASRVLRVSKALLTSIIIAIALTIVTGIVLGLTFRPYRYTDRESDIYNELNCPVPTFPEFNPSLNYRVDENGVKLPEWEARGMYEEECEKKRELARNEWEEKLPKNLIFGGAEQFFQFCNNSDAVTWNPTDIESSIKSREYYLFEKMKRILLITFFASFIISYCILYIRKRGIRIVIE